MSEPRRETGARVLGVGLGLLAVLVLALVAALPRAKTLEPTETLARWFEPQPWAFELQPVEAAQPGDRSTLVRLASPQPPVESPRAEEQMKAPEVQAFLLARYVFGWRGEGRIRWERLPEGAPDTPPVEALLVNWPPQRGAGELRRLFMGGGERSERSGGVLDGLDSEGGKRVLERGELKWGEYSAPFAHEREYERGGTFVDVLRLNLSTESEALVLALRWPRGLPASKPRAEELLASVRRRQSEPQ